MSRQITIKPYQRIFRRSLRTAHGEWAIREGFLVRVEQDEQDGRVGRVGYGEVAPLPSFGSETVPEAAAFLEQLIQEPNLEVPEILPCCAFALSAAKLDTKNPRSYPVSALLPSGSASLRLAGERVNLGYRSMKWKIGVEPIAKEITMARSLMKSLPADARIRFDANAGLMTSELEQWLESLISYRDQVDYIEQPLACGSEAAMAAYMEATGICIALDESLNGADRERWLEPGAWAGPLVIKAPLMGDVERLAKRLEPVADQVVLSSVFETGIGLENSLCLADRLPQLARPIGYDTVGAFDDALNHVDPAPAICAEARGAYDPELIWNLI